MKETDQDQAFVERAKRLLEQGSDALDARTASRLAVIRRQALEAEKPAIPWLKPVAGLVVTCAAVLVVYFVTRHPVQKEMVADLEDIELLSASESLEFYDELEFYGWLAEAEGAG